MQLGLKLVCLYSALILSSECLLLFILTLVLFQLPVQFVSPTEFLTMYVCVFCGSLSSKRETTRVGDELLVLISEEVDR